jgi:peptidoglycan/LPS O-acetylase OafA/YrhL
MNRQFAALRGLAITMVVLYHTIDLSMSIPREWGYPPIEGLGHFVLSLIQQLGGFAVPTFLFISGCFVAYAAGGNPARLSWRTVWGSLKRLLWPYVLWSIAFYIVVYFQRHEVYSFPEYLKSLVVGYPFHFIPSLAFWYALSPVVVRFAKRFGYALIMVILFYQLILMNLEYPGILGFVFPGWVRLLRPPVLGYTMAIWGIYFPLGLIYNLNAKNVAPLLQKLKRGLLATTVVLFVLGFLDTVSVLNCPLASQICPLTFVLFSTMIKRDSIPLVRQFEEVGKHSYGLYLTHLILLDLALVSVKALMPDLLNYRMLLIPPLLVLALAVPLVVMNGVAQLPAKPIYRYMFG